MCECIAIKFILDCYFIPKPRGHCNVFGYHPYLFARCFILVSRHQVEGLYCCYAPENVEQKAFEECPLGARLQYETHKHHGRQRFITSGKVHCPGYFSLPVTTRSPQLSCLPQSRSTGKHKCTSDLCKVSACMYTCYLCTFFSGLFGFLVSGSTNIEHTHKYVE